LDNYTGNMSSLDLLKARAKKGDAKSQFLVGLHHHNEGNYQKALRWYNLAANKGKVEARNYLGLLHQSGKGTIQNFTEAAANFVSAAQAGIKYAEYHLGVLYLEGKGVHQSMEQAASYLTKAAAAQYAPAEYELALLYLKGSGADKNDEKAAELFRRAFAGALTSPCGCEEKLNLQDALRPF
jgi:uncharacterized protein